MVEKQATIGEHLVQLRSRILKCIILRHLESFGLPECVRVSTGAEKDMDIFLNLLSEIVEEI